MRIAGGGGDAPPRHVNEEIGNGRDVARVNEDDERPRIESGK